MANDDADKLGEYELLKLNLERIDAAVNGEYEENDRRLNWFLSVPSVSVSGIRYSAADAQGK